MPDAYLRRIWVLATAILLSVLFLAVITLAYAETYGFILKWGSQGSGYGQFDDPDGVAVDGSGNVYVTDYNKHRVQKFTGDGVFLTKWGTYGSGDGQFEHLRGVAVDASGNVYVADYWNDRGRLHRNGTTAYHLDLETTSNFSHQWTTAENDTDYQLECVIDHGRYGISTWKQYVQPLTRLIHARGWEFPPTIGIPVVGDIWSGLGFLTRLITYVLVCFPLLLTWLGDSFLVGAEALAAWNTIKTVIL